MLLESIDFSRDMHHLHVSVVRVIDKINGVPSEPKEFVEFLIKDGSMGWAHRLTEDETRMLVKMLEEIIE